LKILKNWLKVLSNPSPEVKSLVAYKIIEWSNTNIADEQEENEDFPFLENPGLKDRIDPDSMN